ncbi:MAG: hypothetical protein LBS42_01375 [Tannerella sp.]|jgi:hypothetical protein|nr:hypothetical protein [Tannerella sp.]
MKTILQHIALLSVILLLPAGIRAQSIIRDAEDRFAKGEYENALTVYKAAMITEKDSITYIRARMKYIRECLDTKDRADRHYSAGDCERAMTDYRDLLSKNTHDRHAAECLADCERQTALAAERRRESLLWNEAKQKNTKAVLLLYLEQYPGGAHVDDANRRLDELDGKQWDAIDHNAPDSVLLAYLDEYPDGHHADEARQRLADAADDRRWLEATQENTEASLLVYLDEYPRGQHADEARLRLAVFAEERLWRDAKEENTVHAYRNYLSASHSRTREKEAQKALERIEESLRQAEAVNRAEESLRAGEYAKAWDKMRKVNIAALPPDMRQAAESCLEASEYQTEIKPLFSLWKWEQYLKKYPHSPHRAEMEAKIRRTKRWGKIKPAAVIASGIKLGAYNMASYSWPVYLSLRNKYDVVEFRTGIEFTGYSRNYDLEFLSSEDYNGNGYEITAHQISLPATLKINARRGNGVYLSLTGTYNYNYRGKCFGRRSRNLVNTSTHSGMIALGYDSFENGSNIPFAIELFFRKDFRPLFAGREKIYEFDNFDERNNYKQIDRALNNMTLVGLSLILYLATLN